LHIDPWKIRSQVEFISVPPVKAGFTQCKLCLRGGLDLLALTSPQKPNHNQTNMKKIVPLLALATLVAFSTVNVRAADDAKARPLPFRGKIAAVDKQAKTIKVGERAFQVTADSKIAKAGKPATLDDATVGEEVGGSYREGADKKLNIVSLRIGPRPEAAPKKEPAK
jgi:hypothetical protein